MINKKHIRYTLFVNNFVNAMIFKHTLVYFVSDCCRGHYNYLSLISHYE